MKVIIGGQAWSNIETAIRDIKYVYDFRSQYHDRMETDKEEILKKLQEINDYSKIAHILAEIFTNINCIEANLKSDD